ILILDDVTSAVDSISEKTIQRAIEEQFNVVTKVIVSSKISSIRHADQILVMDDGKIAAMGTHEQLLRESPLYHEMAKTQAEQGAPPVPMRHPGGRFTGPVVKPKNQKETLLRIWSYLRIQKVELISVVIFVIISTLLSLVGPFLIGKTIDDYIVKLDVPGAIRM